MDSRIRDPKEELEREQQPDNAYLVNDLPDETLVHIGSYLPKPVDHAPLAQGCVRLHSIFQPPLDELKFKKFKKLVQAVIDDDKETIKKLLDSNPSLVSFSPSTGIVIESQLTWQRFYIVEDVVTVAARRKQIEMIKLLLSYYDKLEQTDIVKATRTKALSAWSFYEMQKNLQGEEEIVIPQKKYADYAQELIDVFKKESFPNGELSDDAEAALASLFDRLLPENALKLDEDFLDPELFLLAVYKAYRDNFLSFNYNWKQLDTFCIRVIGLTQSVLAPETAKIFCEGLYDVVTVKKEISKRAAEHKLEGG